MGLDCALTQALQQQTNTSNQIIYCIFYFEHCPQLH